MEINGIVNFLLLFLYRMSVILMVYSMVDDFYKYGWKQIICYLQFFIKDYYSFVCV